MHSWNLSQVSSNGLSVEVVFILLCQSLKRVNDVMQVHSSTEFQSRRSLTDGQRTDLFNVDVCDVRSILVVNS
jgi:hypothetical protein